MYEYECITDQRPKCSITGQRPFPAPCFNCSLSCGTRVAEKTQLIEPVSLDMIAVEQQCQSETAWFQTTSTFQGTKLSSLEPCTVYRYGKMHHSSP